MHFNYVEVERVRGDLEPEDCRVTDVLQDSSLCAIQSAFPDSKCFIWNSGRWCRLDATTAPLVVEGCHLQVVTQPVLVTAGVIYQSVLRGRHIGWRPDKGSGDPSTSLGGNKSLTVCQALLGPHLTVLPSLEQLPTALLRRPGQRIMVTSDLAGLCSGTEGYEGFAACISVATVAGGLQPKLDGLLRSCPGVDGGEGMTLHCHLGYFYGLFKAFDENVTPALGFMMTDNKSLESAPSASATQERARPDVILVTKHLLLFLSELKRKSEGLLPALDDMRRKLQQGLPAMHYGNLPYLLAAAQAGTAVQMCAVSADGKVHEIGGVIDISTMRGRADLICVVANAYQILHLMAREVVDVAHRLPMFTPVACGNTTVEFLPGMVCKTMSGFAQSLPHQTLEVVQQAYALGTADSQHYLVGCKAPARLARTKYRVDVTPVGFPHLPRTEQEVGKLVADVARALERLHGAGLVHRDVRQPNVVMLPPPHSHHMLIDLESVAQAGNPWPNGRALLTAWDSHTLAKGRRYTVTSDTYQLGKLMTSLLHALPACSDEAWQCAGALACTAAQHRLSAAAILQHPWIAAQQ